MRSRSPARWLDDGGAYSFGRAVEGGGEEDDGNYEIRRVRLQPEMLVSVSYIYIRLTGLFSKPAN